jgi:hypothetical protein
VIRVDGTHWNLPYSLRQDTILRLQNVTMASNSPKHLSVNSVSGYAEYRGLIYSDVARGVYVQEEDRVRFASPLQKAPAARPGLTAKSPWLLVTQKARSRSQHLLQPLTVPTDALIAGSVFTELMEVSTQLKGKGRTRAQTSK